MSFVQTISNTASERSASRVDSVASSVFPYSYLLSGRDQFTQLKHLDKPVDCDETDSLYSSDSCYSQSSWNSLFSSNSSESSFTSDSLLSSDSHSSHSSVCSEITFVNGGRILPQPMFGSPCKSASPLPSPPLQESRHPQSKQATASSCTSRVKALDQTQLLTCVSPLDRLVSQLPLEPGPKVTLRAAPACQPRVESVDPALLVAASSALTTQCTDSLSPFEPKRELIAASEATPSSSSSSFSRAKTIHPARLLDAASNASSLSPSEPPRKLVAIPEGATLSSFSRSKSVHPSRLLDAAIDAASVTPLEPPRELVAVPEDATLSSFSRSKTVHPARLLDAAIDSAPLSLPEPAYETTTPPLQIKSTTEFTPSSVDGTDLLLEKIVPRNLVKIPPFLVGPARLEATYRKFGYLNELHKMASSALRAPSPAQAQLDEKPGSRLRSAASAISLLRSPRALRNHLSQRKSSPPSISHLFGRPSRAERRAEQASKLSPLAEEIEQKRTKVFERIMELKNAIRANGDVVDEQLLRRAQKDGEKLAKNNMPRILQGDGEVDGARGEEKIVLVCL